MTQSIDMLEARAKRPDYTVTLREEPIACAASRSSLLSQLTYPLRLAAAFFTLSLFFVGSLFLGLAVLPLIAVVSLLLKRRPYDLCRRFVHTGFAWYLRLVRIVRLVEFRFFPLEASKEDFGPFVAVANHPSLLDTPVMGAFLGPTTFTIRHTAARFTVSLASYLCGYLPIRHGSLFSAEEFIAAASARIRRGEPVMMFPEGTRSPPEGTHRFIRIPFDVAARAGVPLRVFAIRCRPRILTKEKTVFQWPSQMVSYDIIEVARFDIEPNPGAARKARNEAQRRINETLRAK